MVISRRLGSVPVAVALLIGAAACGTESPSGGSSPSITSSASVSVPPVDTTPKPANSGIVPDTTWAGVFKQAIPPLAETSDAAVVTAARGVCTTFVGAPTKETATAVLTDLETSLGIDATQARVFASGAITHFCTAHSDAWTTATLG